GTRSASHFAADADLDLDINREGQFGVVIGDHVTRSDRNISTPALGYGTLSLYNDARLKLNIRPYTGSVTIEPGYHFTTEIFSTASGISTCTGTSDASCDPAKIGAYDYLNHTVNLNGRWKFLPKTAMTLDSAFGARSYINSGASQGIMTLKAAIGLAGLLTTHWEVLLRAGWGHDFTAGTYSSIIGQAEVGYLFSETGSIRAGYVRTFEPTGGAYISFGDDRAYLDARLLLGGKLTVRGGFSFDYLSFRGATTEFSQYNVALDVGADYEIKPWVSIGGHYRLSYLTSPDGSVQVGLSSFVRNEGGLKLQFIY
ncbi:MAG: hypothetical protein HY901_30740, partial [Deltaproteobacteria bacterium]|nr:hypothetical protein [Deltaproteobacteria bacterium]